MKNEVAQKTFILLDPDTILQHYRTRLSLPLNLAQQTMEDPKVVLHAPIRFSDSFRAYRIVNIQKP